MSDIKTKADLAILSPATTPIPVVIADCGDKASERFFTFFTDTIRNKNTRATNYRNALRFFAWASAHGLGLTAIKSYHVSAYLEELSVDHAAPSVKQHLATLRMLFDWLILGHVLEINPSAAVRGPTYVVKKGKTPVLNAEAARQLLDSIGDGDLVRLRDRALISVCLYSFARIEAALGMDVGDYYPNGKRWWFRLREKGGKPHDMPAHHNAEAYLDAYVQAAGLADQKREPLFRSAVGKTRVLSTQRMTRHAALKMIQRRALEAEINTPVCCHSFRATGITNYLTNGGTLEKAQRMACHERPRRPNSTTDARTS